MAAAISVRIPAGKLGTVRVDRTVDVYPASAIADDNHPFNSNSPSTCVPTLALHRQLTKTARTATPTALIIEPIEHDAHQAEQLAEAHGYVPVTKWFDHPNGNNNNNNNNEFDDEHDIAVIYSVVRQPNATRGASSSPQIVVSTPTTTAKSAERYALEAPLTPVVTHTSKQAQIKSLPSTRSIPSADSCLSTSLIPPNPPAVRIQSSTSFTSHDRPSIPSIAIKPRPYSFRSAINPPGDVSALQTPAPSNSAQAVRARRSFRAAPRNVIERQLSNLSGRVSQLHDSFLARLSDFTSGTSSRQRNRSLTSLHSHAVHAPNPADAELRVSQNTSAARQQRRAAKPRPKSETFEDHHRVNAGKSSLHHRDRCCLLLHETSPSLPFIFAYFSHTRN